MSSVHSTEVSSKICMYEEEIKANIDWERSEQGGKGERKKKGSGVRKKTEAGGGERVKKREREKRSRSKKKTRGSQKD